MHTMMLQAGLFQQFLEFLPYCRLRKVTAVPVGKHQVREFSLVPKLSGCQPHLSLTDSVTLQDLNHKLCGHDYSGFPIFQRNEGIFRAGLAGLHQLLFDRDNSFVKINTIPRQPNQLPAAQAGEQIHDDY